MYIFSNAIWRMKKNWQEHKNAKKNVRNRKSIKKTTYRCNKQLINYIDVLNNTKLTENDTIY